MREVKIRPNLENCRKKLTLQREQLDGCSKAACGISRWLFASFQIFFLVFGPKPQSIESRSPPNLGFSSLLKTSSLKY